MLDHRMYPQIIDDIISHAPHDSLIALRATSRQFRDRVDELLDRVVDVVAPVKPVRIKQLLSANPAPDVIRILQRRARLPCGSGGAASIPEETYRWEMVDSNVRPREERRQRLLVFKQVGVRPNDHLDGERQVNQNQDDSKQDEDEDGDEDEDVTEGSEWDEDSDAYSSDDWDEDDSGGNDNGDAGDNSGAGDKDAEAEDAETAGDKEAQAAAGDSDAWAADQSDKPVQQAESSGIRDFVYTITIGPTSLSNLSSYFRRQHVHAWAHCDSDQLENVTYIFNVVYRCRTCPNGTWHSVAAGVDDGVEELLSSPGRRSPDDTAGMIRPRRKESCDDVYTGSLYHLQHFCKFSPDVNLEQLCGEVFLMDPVDALTEEGAQPYLESLKKTKVTLVGNRDIAFFVHMLMTRQERQEALVSGEADETTTYDDSEQSWQDHHLYRIEQLQSDPVAVIERSVSAIVERMKADAVESGLDESTFSEELRPTLSRPTHEAVEDIMANYKDFTLEEFKKEVGVKQFALLARE